ncbi:MAG TPA: FecR domain-containing protein, partial [Candidatus Nitrosotalea sp.]|nr:FecR domain-containing protein [Candidatus Nitrosotalea sp.]
AENRELQALLAKDPQARAGHIHILQIEAGLRGQRQNVDVVGRVMQSLHLAVTDSVTQTVMTQIKMGSAPEWRQKEISQQNMLDESSEEASFQSFRLGIRLLLRRLWLPIVVCLVLALTGLGVWYFNPTVGKPALADIQGSGLILERADQRLPATVGVHLEPGDLLRTPDNVSATIGYAPEPTRVKLLPGTELRLAATARGKLFALVVGKLEATVARQTPFRPMIISTPQARARVIGTRFTLTVKTNSTRLDVMEGKVRFTRESDSRFVKVTTGHYAVATPDYQLASLPFTGGLLRVWWSGVEGNTLFNNPRFRNPPDGREIVPDFKLAVAETNAFAVRVCGYVHPPVTGNYRFWLEKPPIDFADTGYAQLAMSPTEDPSEAVRIARTASQGNGMTSLSPYRAVGATTAPPPVPLVAGRRYYIQANLFIKKGKAELSVFWQPPGQERCALSSEFLSPWEGKIKANNP